jgi:hypothetical protein
MDHLVASVIRVPGLLKYTLAESLNLLIDSCDIQICNTYIKLHIWHADRMGC